MEHEENNYTTPAEYFLRAAGFTHSSWIESMKQAIKENKRDKRLEDFLNQDDLNIVSTVSAIVSMSELNGRLRR